MSSTLVIGCAKKNTSADGRYIEFCKSCFPRNLSLRDKKIVLELLMEPHHFAEDSKRTRAEVGEIGNKPNGININDCGELFFLKAR